MKPTKTNPILLDVITLFPEMFSALTEQGVVRRAFELGLVDEGRCIYHHISSLVIFRKCNEIPNGI